MQLLTQYFSNLNSKHLGLHEDKFALKEYQPEWKRLFSKEAHRIYDHIRIEDLRLYHIGSTAVPGLLAKPIIDILGDASDLELLDSKNKSFEQLGYICRGEYGISGRRYYKLVSPDNNSYFHIHVFKRGHLKIERHLLFRDFLLSDLQSRNLYQEIKSNFLANKLPRSSYSHFKSSIVTQIENSATSWNISRKIKRVALLGSSTGGKQTLSYFNELLGNDQNIEAVDLSKLQIDHYKYDNSNLDKIHLSVMNKIVQADELYLCSPVYWYSMSSLMKTFVDHLPDYLSGSSNEISQCLNGKKVFLVSAGSDDTLPLGFEAAFAQTCLYFGMDYMGASYKQYV